MTQRKKGAAARKSAAARAEKKPTTKKIEFRGLELKLPKTLPGNIAFDWADLVSGRVDILSGSIQLLESVLGPGQLHAVREKSAQEDFTKMESFFTELVNEIFESYGMGSGE